MPTRNQLFKNIRIRRTRLRMRNSPALWGCPQKLGICRMLYVMSPRKPNSAKRRVARVLLVHRHNRWYRFKDRIYQIRYLNVLTYIPGIGSNLQQFGRLLVRGGRTQDLPSVHYKAVRGCIDLGGVIKRRTSRSRYGVPR
jgi:small subunit ribosomal protein S12